MRVCARSYMRQNVLTEPFYEYSGYATKLKGGAGTIPKYRTYTILDCRKGAWDAFVGHTFVSSVKDIGTGGSSASAPANVAGYHQIDLGLSYEFTTRHFGYGLDGLKLSVGVNNVLNREPPQAPDAFSDTNADVGTYNGSIGRMYYINAKYSF